MNDKKNIFIAILILIILALAIWLWKEKDSDDVVIINNNQQSQLPTTSVEDNISSPAQPVGQQIQPADKAPVPFSESFASGNWLLNAVTLKGKVVDMNINVPAPLTLNFDKAKKRIYRLRRLQ
jgi:regulatory protein YycI of two-component signal transduction system YycFG